MDFLAVAIVLLCAFVAVLAAERMVRLANERAVKAEARLDAVRVLVRAYLPDREILRRIESVIDGGAE